MRDGSVLLVHRPRYDDWSLPKGKLDNGESPLETAVREVREETGFSVKVTGYAGAFGYTVKRGPKAVLFWTMAPRREYKIRDTREVDAIEWLTVKQAMKRMTYELEIELLAKAASSMVRS